MGIVHRLKGKGKRQPDKGRMCPKCKQVFQEYLLKKIDGGKIAKYCPFCGV